uniref:DUF4219 domain-containing protein n=1 Tax=Lactuca sativa TaxID=4236 RepID=A0A9R1XLI3_LACSA|nr:hypothetical protein LSAT_V11C400219390 [Lactuca sativa]
MFPAFTFSVSLGCIPKSLWFVLMAQNLNTINMSHPQIPIFKVDFYEFWSTKMKTLFKSQDLWDLVENGYAEASIDETRQKENQKKDAKALFFIQQAVDETIFPRICSRHITRCLEHSQN